MTDDARPYLNAHLDQLTAANATGDAEAADGASAELISADNQAARAAIADALRLAAARDTHSESPPRLFTPDTH